VVDSPAFVPVPSVADPSPTPENSPALPSQQGLPGEVAGAVPPRTSDLRGPADDEDAEAEEYADSSYGVAPIVIASTTCVLLGNIVYDAGTRDRGKARRRWLPALP